MDDHALEGQDGQQGQPVGLDHGPSHQLIHRPLEQEGHQRPGQTQQHPLHDEGPANEGVGRPAHLHNGDLLPAVEESQLDGVGDDKQGHHSQHGHQHRRHTGGDIAHQDKALGDVIGSVYVGHAGDLLYLL